MEKQLDKEVILSAKKFLKSNDAGILSTLTKYENEIYPTGSMCTYVLSDEGDIIILISDLALHTKNILADNNVSMSFYEPNSKNRQTSQRISVVGKAVKVQKDTKEFEQINKKYATFFPESKTFLQIKGFDYYTIKPLMSHYIQTFGKIFTFEGSLLHDKIPAWIEKRCEIVEEINEKYKEKLLAFLKDSTCKNIDESKVKLVNIDNEGFHLALNDSEFCYFNFKNEVNNQEDIEKEFSTL